MAKLKKRILTIFFVFLLSSLVYLPSSVVYANVPHLLNYQGRLTDSSGTPLNGTYALTFRIYDAESAGNLLWEETQSWVVIQKGIFSILLGSVTNLNLPFDKPYFLEIKVGNEVMSPRQAITSSGYAIRAEHGVPKGVIVMWSGKISDIPSGWALCDGTNGTPDLRDKFIVGARQDDGGIAKTNVSGGLLQTGGEAYHTLTTAEIPAHTHQLYGDRRHYDGSAQGAVGYHGGIQPGYADTTSVGGGKAHNNLPPYYALAYIMKL